MGSRERIGLIGIGLIGSAVAERLARAGFTVLGHDIESDRAEVLGALGGESAADGDAVFASCERVILSLPDDRVAGGILDAARIREEQIIIDTTTGHPAAAERCAASLASKGASYLDATISGNSAQVREGKVLVLVGGSAPAVDRCRDIFGTFAERTIRTGEAGSGARMKLVTNLALGLARAALAEALGFARALGLDPDLSLEALRASAAYSRAMDVKGEKMIRREFAPQARLSQHLKDVRIILDLGEGKGAYLPLSRLHRELLEAAEAAGLGELDNSAIAEVFARRDR
ncbi:MAG: NAD(P)-dependent oxidoreductase [Planctomycetes bacterium]|nr:NAD(P)-dependent oxidoreductase [Planctomycetota bacterium]